MQRKGLTLCAIFDAMTCTVQPHGSRRYNREDGIASDISSDIFQVELSSKSNSFRRNNGNQ